MRLFSDIGEKSDLSCPLDSYSELALMLCAGSGDPSGQYLSALADELPEAGSILVVDILDLVSTESADFLSLALSVAELMLIGIAFSIHNH